MVVIRHYAKCEYLIVLSFLGFGEKLFQPVCLVLAAKDVLAAGHTVVHVVDTT
jgi:hypothetical protein